MRQRLYLAEPELWSVDSPALYTARTTLTGRPVDPADDVVTTFGIRTVTVDPEVGVTVAALPKA